jgi:group I intron endonuclease
MNIDEQSGTMADGRYANGKIYKLVNNVDDEFYVGSTCTTLAKRLYGHKSNATKQTSMRVYQHLNEIGWEYVNIVLIQEYPCENKMQLERRERYWIEEMKPTLNKNIPTRSKQEWRVVNADKERESNAKYRAEHLDKERERKAKYRVENAEKLREYKAKYRAENADKILEKEAKYRAENADKVRESQAKYYAENADKVREKHAKYREANREVINARNRAYRAKKKAEREAS